MAGQFAAGMNYDEITIDYDDLCVAESKETDASSRLLDLDSEQKNVFIRKALVRVEEESTEYDFIKKRFMKGMQFMGPVTALVAIHKNIVSSDLRRMARSDSFGIFSRALSEKCGGNANVGCAWYGGSLNELLEIVSFGFSKCASSYTTEEDDSHDFGIHLFPFSLDGAVITVAEKDGSRHALLCRVILGRVEAVPAGSKQSQPSSMHYDSGVDDTSAPRKYIVWTAFMNSHIHPDYIISFKYTYSTDYQLSQNVTYPVLLAKLSEHLEPSKIALLIENYRQHKDKKISTGQFMTKTGEIMGERLLSSIFRRQL